jgi:hypothetical protein
MPVKSKHSMPEVYTQVVHACYQLTGSTYFISTLFHTYELQMRNGPTVPCITEIPIAIKMPKYGSAKIMLMIDDWPDDIDTQNYCLGHFQYYSRYAETK